MNHGNRKRILLADDREDYRRSVIALLELEGYAVAKAGTPEEAMELLETEEFDLALADLRMRDEADPNDVSGLAIAKFASERGIPCIIMTAFPTVELARTALRSRGAEPFAEDLITKASGPQALIDSIKLTLRSKSPEPEKPFVADGLLLDPEKRLVWKNGKLLKLSKNQYTLLEVLYNKDGGVCSCRELIKAIYEEDLTDSEAQRDRRLRNLVDRTKEKIEDEDSGHEYIEAVPGRGFRLNLKA